MVVGGLPTDTLIAGTVLLCQAYQQRNTESASIVERTSVSALPQKEKLSFLEIRARELKAGPVYRLLRADVFPHIYLLHRLQPGFLK
jgi:hypothetical protein